MRGDSFLLTAGQHVACWLAALEVPLHISSDPVVVVFQQEKTPLGLPISLPSWEILHSTFVKRIPRPIFYTGQLPSCSFCLCLWSEMLQWNRQLCPGLFFGIPLSVQHDLFNAVVKMKNKLRYH